MMIATWYGRLIMLASILVVVAGAVVGEVAGGRVEGSGSELTRGTTGRSPIQPGTPEDQNLAETPDQLAVPGHIRQALDQPRRDFADSGWVLVDTDSLFTYLPVATACAVHFDNAARTLDVIVPSLPLTPLALQAIDYAPDWLGLDLADSFRRMDASHQDLYAGIILGTSDPIVDEVAFVIAHTAPEVLQSSGFPTGLLTENAQSIYAHDALLDYVDVVDYGSASAGGDYYSTVRYRTVEAGETLEVVLPRERYYWDIVHPKITDEFPTYIDPATGATAAPPVGKFWRDFLFAYADSGYPVLKDQLAGCRALWEGNVDSKTNGAIGILTQWILDVMDFGSGEERPIQPVRIYRLHLGRCGEHADITAAAARAALIPTNSASSFDNDHTWNEFWDRRWIAWEPVNVYIDAPWHYEGWGMQFIGVFDWRGDDGVWTVAERYTPYCTFTAVVTDSRGYPVDGAQVAIARKTGTVTYPISTWGSTDSNGRCTFLLGDNQDIYARIESNLGTVPPGSLYKLAVAGSVAGQEYIWAKSLGNPRPQLPMLPIAPPANQWGEYQLRVSWNVASEYCYGRNRLDNNTASDNFPGGAIGFFVCDGANYGAYAAADTFRACNIAEDAPSGSLTFEIPTDDDWYAVLSNQEHVVSSQVVRGVAQLYCRAAAGVAAGNGSAPRVSLAQNRPNPSAGETWIQFAIPTDLEVDLAVYDIGGRRIATLASGHETGGEHRVAWQGRDDTGRPVAPGVYFYRLTTAGSTLSRKLVLLD